MKRSCFSLSPDFSADNAPVARQAQDAMVGTFLLAITVAVALFGTIWFG
jgi:hypothetical protein